MNQFRLNILISPLDWGLGHATRCMPIIQYFLQGNHNVYIAASGLSLKLLRNNLGDSVHYLDIPGNNVQYSHKARYFYWQMFKQLPHIYRTIQKENALVKEWQNKYGFDLIISDNRYGLSIKNTKTVFLTHQYQIKSGWGRWVDALLLRWHESQMKKFHYVGIVDNISQPLAPELSAANRSKRINVSYIGWLSQLEKGGNASIQPGEKPKILCLLSGPEPSRTQLQNLLLDQAKLLGMYEFVIITGSDDSGSLEVACDHITVIGLANHSKVRELILRSDLIICRSGYSTLMDLIQLRKSALLIPTPGQNEQLYLAKHLNNQKVFHTQLQESLELSADIAKALKYKGFKEMEIDVNKEAFQFFDKLLKENFNKI